MTGPKDSPPTTAEAIFAAIEAEALSDLITAASGNAQAVLSDDSIENAGYMLTARLAIMREFIEAKRDEEKSKGPRALAG